MALNADDPRAPYRQIAGDLRQAIRSGELGPGDKLPSARDLMDRYGVATQTIQSATRLLREEGLIVSVHGRGTFVRRDVEIGPDSGESSPEQIVHRLVSIENEVRQLKKRLSQVEAKQRAPKRS